MKKFIVFFLVLAFIGGFFELLSRFHYASRKKISFFASSKELVYGWYPELRALEKYKHKEDHFNVLLLGGSVLEEHYGVPEILRQTFSNATSKKLNLGNFATAAHSSQDSAHKYSLTAGYPFDLVIFYHGINELRANYVSPNRYKPDYAHYSWYDEVNFFFRYPFLLKTGLMFPFRLRKVFVTEGRRLFGLDMDPMPVKNPSEKWYEYGKEIKTKETFKKNLEKIAKFAAIKGDRLMVMTFAYTDYAPFKPKTKMWGKPEYVEKGIAAHNEVTRELAQKHNLLYLDQHRLMANESRHFIDICHLNQEGGKFYIENILSTLKSKGVL